MSPSLGYPTQSYCSVEVMDGVGGRRVWSYGTRSVERVRTPSRGYVSVKRVRVRREGTCPSRGEWRRRLWCVTRRENISVTKSEEPESVVYSLQKVVPVEEWKESEIIESDRYKGFSCKNRSRPSEWYPTDVKSHRQRK